MLARTALRLQTTAQPARAFASQGGGFFSWLFPTESSSHSFASTKTDPLMPSFKDLDVNKDGVVSRDELINGVLKLGLNHLTPREASSLFDELDTNKDGVLTEDEFYHHAWHAHAKKAIVNHFCFETGMTAYHEDPSADEHSREFQSACDQLFNNSVPCVITHAGPPYDIVHLNSAWSQLTGFSAMESYGQTLALLRGPETDRHVLRTMMDGVRQGKGSDATVISYNKDGEAFRNYMKVEPIHSDDGRVTHFIATFARQDAAQATASA